MLSHDLLFSVFRCFPIILNVKSFWFAVGKVITDSFNMRAISISIPLFKIANYFPQIIQGTGWRKICFSNANVSLIEINTLSKITMNPARF